MKPVTIVSTLACVALVQLLSCASTGGPEGGEDVPEAKATESGKIIFDPSKPPAEAAKPLTKTSPMESRVTVELNASNIGDAVRQLGQTHGGNLVLMAGAEARPVVPGSFKRAELSEVATSLAASAGLAVQETPEYYFLFPPGYEPLVDVSMSNKLPSGFDVQNTDVTFGFGLRLYTVFAWMGYALDRTIVADNSVADARCGELALSQVPLDAAIEAVLKSARVNSFAVDSSEEYVFLYNPNNANPADALLNTNTLDADQQAILNRTVSLILPLAPTAGHPLEMQQHHSNLGEVLSSISAQLGVTVVAEEGLGDLPVNPAVMMNVKLRTAMNLLVRQWLIPNYGYQVTHDRIVIRTRQP